MPKITVLMGSLIPMPRISYVPSAWSTHSMTQRILRMAGESCLLIDFDRYFDYATPRHGYADRYNIIISLVSVEDGNSAVLMIPGSQYRQTEWIA